MKLNSQIEFSFPGPGESSPPPRPLESDSFRQDIQSFRMFGAATVSCDQSFRGFDGKEARLKVYSNEFWTSRQRAANRLHEISYRACFKPQLPRFFVERLTAPGDTVYDPFMGRGTTLLEAALLGRVPVGCDVNPLSQILVQPRLCPPMLSEVSARLREICWQGQSEFPEELLVFYHPQTLRQIVSLREYLLDRQARAALDAADEWIRMIAVNRLTGHSAGFFSVYTLPPNQAVSVQSQKRINERRNQTPPLRDVPAIIAKKSRSLLTACDETTRRRLNECGKHGRLFTRPASDTPGIPSNSVHLIVTSPPFLDVVNYATDNWLRCWFLGIDAKSIQISVVNKLADWRALMTAVFRELERVLVPGGRVAFEIGEVRGGTIKLEDAAVPCGLAAGLEPELVMINQQEFTKTANCWGVDNGAKGTNTNRIALFRKGSSRS